MRMFFGGSTGYHHPKRERQICQLINSRLMSYYEHIHLYKSLGEFLEMKKKKVNPQHRVNLFLDSGAFSAKEQDVEINLDEYIRFIKKHEKYIEVYANLDVIGNAEATLKNQKIMEKAGLHPLPTYHVGEDESYLDYYIDNYDYMAFGGMARNSIKDRIAWLDRIFPKTCDENGMPKIKVHGFGMTSLVVMLRYPWYSVDSTSWVTTGRMGGVLFPKKTNGVYDYSINPFKLDVSAKSPSTKIQDKHLLNLSKAKQKFFLDYLAEKGYALGKSSFRVEDKKTYKLKEKETWFKKGELPVKGMPISEPENQGSKKEKKNNKSTDKQMVETIIEHGICNDYKLRDKLNIIYFLDLEKFMPRWPWKFVSKSNLKGFF